MTNKLPVKAVLTSLVNRLTDSIGVVQTSTLQQRRAVISEQELKQQSDEREDCARS